MSKSALIAWLDAGLLAVWLKGHEGWPHLIVGPYAWQSLTTDALETEYYQGALQRAMDARTAFVDHLRNDSVQEVPPIAPPSLNLGTLEDFWKPALSLFAAAREAKLAVWADDLFMQLSMDLRGSLSSEEVVRRGS
jgi:hypothetical protein